jgi:Spy/CpxP family protein refolding chaperone
MRLLRWAEFALIVAFLLSATGARATQAPPPTTAASPAASSAAPADDAATTELKEHHRHHHHGGVTRFIAMSLDTLGVDDAKRPQIEKLQADLHAQMVPAREAERNLLLTIADGVAAGTVDKAKVDAAIEKLTTTNEGVHEASLDTLNKLHAILSPSERAALVDKVEAHWEVWRQVNHDAEPGGREKGGRLAELTEEASLTPDQVSKMSAALHTAMAGLHSKFDPSRGEAHVHAFATAFAGDTFDAKAVTSNANAHLASRGATRTALFYETVTPLLTPEQRTKLAAHLKEHASHHSAASAK